MTTGRNGESTRDDLALLERVLEAYGGEEARWPAPLRERCQKACATAEGARLLRQARALDLLLTGLETKSFEPPTGRTALLADRIMAEVARQPQAAQRADTVVAKTVAMTAAPARRAGSTRAAAPSRWLPAAAVAASLIVGIGIGAGTSVGSAIGDIADAIGIGSDFGSVSLAYRDGASGFDEDML